MARLALEQRLFVDPDARAATEAIAVAISERI
jgi:hypothetical protein